MVQAVSAERIDLKMILNVGRFENEACTRDRSGTDRRKVRADSPKTCPKKSKYKIINVKCKIFYGEALNFKRKTINKRANVK